MNTQAKILLVDDEENIRSSLHKILTKEGYEVIAAENGLVALNYIATELFDLALIDLKLPKISGIQVLESLRQHAPDTVAIILTAHGSLDTAVKALKQGAHDYLFKPCDPTELRASIRQGLLTRQQRHALLNELENLSDHLEDIRVNMTKQYGWSRDMGSRTTNEPRKRFFQYGNLTVDTLQHLITIQGKSLPLTATEFELMAYLIQKAPQVVSPQELMQAVQGYEGEPWEANVTIRSHIYHIRQKIKKTVGLIDIIRTMRGVGYKISQS